MFIIYFNLEPQSVLHINTQYFLYGFNIHEDSQECHFHVIDERVCFVLFGKPITPLLSVFEMPVLDQSAYAALAGYSDSRDDWLQAPDDYIRASIEMHNFYMLKYMIVCISFPLFLLILEGIKFIILKLCVKIRVRGSLHLPLQTQSTLYSSAPLLPALGGQLL